jgi:DNA-binding beta-propeller fold protein YncE
VGAILCVALACAWAGVRAERALAEGCPGSGVSSCPYASALLIGQRAEGMLRFPEAVAVDASGNVYVADQLSYVVQKFSAAGAFESEWGSYGGGHGQFGPIGGLATDAAGNVYVLDSSHNRIEKFNPNGEFISDWGHTGDGLGQFDFGSSENYTKPPGGGIAVAGDYVYVADSGNDRIERFTLQGTEPMQWGTKGSGPGEFSYPRGIAANETEVLVADSDNHRIEKFATNGAFEAEVGSQGSGPGQFGFPYGVALDAAGNVYVADDLNDRVVKLTTELDFAAAWGGFGSQPGQLAFPRALASGPAGDTYVADTANDRVEVFNPEGEYLRSLGTSARAPGAFTAPRGLATDPTGELLVSDTDENRIELFSAAGDAFAGAWTTAGGFSRSFGAPAGIGVDPRGEVYVADQSDERVVRLWGDGTFLSELGGPGEIGGAQLDGASAIAVAAQTGKTYVADSAHNRVLVYSPQGSLLAKWGADDGDGAPGSEAGQFNDPVALAVADNAASGGGENVYVADVGNDRIVELSPSGSVLRQWGSAGTGDGKFRNPSGIALDAAGDVFVVDSLNNRVQVFDPEGRFLEKWGLRGTEPGDFSQPTAIAVDCAGNVYVADTNNNRVERFALVSPAPSGCLAAGTWPRPLDVAPVLHVTLLRRAHVLARRALALGVSCERGCAVFVTATLSPARGGPAVKLTPYTRTLPRALPGHVRVLVGRSALRRLRRALGRRAAMRATVRIIAVGPTGLRTTVTRIYAVER